MDVVQASIGRFHHFHLARQMERHGLLDCIWTGYPAFKLKDETGIPPEKIHSFPWVQTLFMGWPRVPVVGRIRSMQQGLSWLAQDSLDHRVAAHLKAARNLIALSGQGEHSGRRAQQLGGRHICDRGSSHIRYQDDLMREEHARWKMDYQPIDLRMIAKEEREYAGADLITVPSGFAERSFLACGVPAEKLRRIPYGGRLDRFAPRGAPSRDAFNVLYVGHVTLRKGFPYLLQAFASLKHPAKRLRVIGGIDPVIKSLLSRLPSERVEYLGTVPNGQLAQHYSESHVMVLPSIEEGLAMVMAEAMACGCPVIASTNTGAEDLFDDQQEGLIVPIRSSDAIAGALSRLAEDPVTQAAYRQASMTRIKAIDGWNTYGDAWKRLLDSLERAGAPKPATGMVQPAHTHVQGS